MTAIDLVDSTWVSAPAPRVAALVADPARWPRWWPGLALHEPLDRGVEGMMWRVSAVAETGGIACAGEAEVWLQPSLDGLTAHFFLRVDPCSGGTAVPDRLRRQVVHHYRTRAKLAFWEIADELDSGRARRLLATSLGPAASTS